MADVQHIGHSKVLCVQPALPLYAVLSESIDGYNMNPCKNEMKNVYTRFIFCDFVADADLHVQTGIQIIVY